MSKLYRYQNQEANLSVLIVFKFPSQWNTHTVEVYSKKNSLFVLYLEQIADQGTKVFLEYVAAICNRYNITSILLDPEFYPFISPFTIRKLRKIRPCGIFLFDPYLYPLALLNAWESSFVITACPHLAIDLESYGVQSIFMPLECGESNVGKFKKILDRPSYDVLFYGTLSTSRRPFIEHLSKMTQIKVKIHDSGTNPVTYDDIPRLIQDARISINLSQFELRSHNSSKPLEAKSFGILGSHAKSRYGFKGRVGEVALSGRMLVSEFSPAFKLLSMHDVVPQFTDVLQMETILNNLLLDDTGELEKQTELFCGKGSIIFSALNNAVRFESFLANICNSAQSGHICEDRKYMVEDLEGFYTATHTRFKSNLQLLGEELSYLDSLATHPKKIMT